MKDELGGKIMIKFVRLRVKNYSYLMDDNGDKKGKGTKKCVLKRKLKFENYKNCLEVTQFKSKINDLKNIKLNSYRIHKKQYINIKNTAKI